MTLVKEHNIDGVIFAVHVSTGGKFGPLGSCQIIDS